MGKNIKVGGYLTKQNLLDTNQFSRAIFSTIALFVGISIYYCHKVNFCSFHFFAQAFILISGSVAFVIINKKAFMKGYNFATDLYDEDHKLLKRSTKKKK